MTRSGPTSDAPTVAIVTLGCARNEVDSDELAGRLDDGGFRLVDDPAEADAVLVNTCGFIEQAKRESIDTVLAAADLGPPGTATVVAVGCLAERYGSILAEALPEATAVLGFDDYPQISERLRAVLDGSLPATHQPRDRRTLLPLAPAERRPGSGRPGVPPGPDLPDGVSPASGPRVVRRRLGSGPVAPVKLASGCDRRCSFCAIPSFRGAFTSRPPDEIVAEVEWLADHGVREVFLVSENSTSYGKDLGDIRLLESLLPRLADVQGIARVRVSYLQPAETRPTLLDVLAATPGVAPYFDLSFQHASPAVLRRMRRFGSSGEFLGLLEGIRTLNPHAGVRSNVIVGFPGETEEDVIELEHFLMDAELDAIGVFGFSPEEGTEAADLPDQVDPDEVLERVARVSALADELVTQRAVERIGDAVGVLVLSADADDVDGLDGAGVGEVVATRAVLGLADHQGPDVDGTTIVLLGPEHPEPVVGDLLAARVVASDGVDLIAQAVPTP
jgi:ribosomal protein S12 methylthiotransferase